MKIMSYNDFFQFIIVIDIFAVKIIVLIVIAIFFSKRLGGSLKFFFCLRVIFQTFFPFLYFLRILASGLPG